MKILLFVVAGVLTAQPSIRLEPAGSARLRVESDG